MSCEENQETLRLEALGSASSNLVFIAKIIEATGMV